MGKDSFLGAKKINPKTHKLSIDLRLYKPLYKPGGAKKKTFDFSIVNKSTENANFIALLNVNQVWENFCKP